MNLEFTFQESPVVFHIEELNAKSRAIHERAVARAQKYLVSEGELLESIIEADQDKLYEKFGLGYLTSYCVKHLGLDETVAGVLVRVARKSQVVPELRVAVMEGDVSISSAKTIASVINSENQAQWIEKAKTLMKVFSYHKDPVCKADRSAKRRKERDASQDVSATTTPAEVTHAVNLRDRGRCRGKLADGSECGETRWTHHHHIVPTWLGGEDVPENIITLCSAHHRLWHKREGV